MRRSDKISGLMLLYTLLSGCLDHQPKGKLYMLDSQGSIVRGDTTRCEIALIFSADSLAEGKDYVAQVLERENIKGSFFFTGNFYRNASSKTLIDFLIRQNHYVGAHSDRHLLYCDWNNRDSTLVSKQQFLNDLNTNYLEMSKFGISKSEAIFFLPPYEWYNRDIVEWTTEFGLKLMNFTAGSRTNADYTFPEMGDKYMSSEAIFSNLLKLEENNPSGLNGYILLIHPGTDARRKDKFYHYLPRLIRVLKERGYTFVLIDELLK
jgi:peptidoglycan/xylan/chitin deacetylase (PgdA/CDA1 family)